MKNYHRIVEFNIKGKMTDEQIVNIVGPHECGKTSVALKFAKSVISKDTDSDSLKRLSEFKPELALNSEKPLLIDDVEKMPHLMEAIIKSSKKVQNNGLYLTTSSTAIENSIQMSPMTLFESGESTGKIPILSLFDNPNLPIEGIESSLELDTLIKVTSRGGFPKALKNPKEMREYMDRVINKYVPETCGSKRDSNKFKVILKSYSDNVYDFTKTSEILNQIRQELPNISKTTYYTYINDLKKIQVIDEIPAWEHKVKTSSSLKTSPKRGFCDPSIPISLLNMSFDDLLLNLEKYEYFFKGLCYRDLKVYSSARNGKISHYADRNGFMVDCVLELENGDYAFIVFSLSTNNINKKVKKLIKFSKFVEKKIESGVLDIKKPKFLAIITASYSAYTHRSGVKIIPIGVLR